MVGKIISVPKPLTANQVKILEKLKKLRASGDGKALTTKQKETLIELQFKEIKSRKYKLSDGQKTILSELVYAEKFGRSKVLYADALTKGIEQEKESRDLLSKVVQKYLIYSTERKTNDWVTGAIDIKPVNDVIIDLKTAYSWQSFTKILQDKPNEIYLRQLDSYMDLWGLKDSLLVHTLVNTPFEIIEKEIRSADYRMNLLNMEGNVRDEAIPEVKKIIYNHIFDEKGLNAFCEYSSQAEKTWFDDFKEIPESQRVHMIAHPFDKARIEQRNKCISLAREFMNTVTTINNLNPQILELEKEIS
jgi:thioredoxin-related protein